MMQIHHIEPLTRAEGPGVRYAIWVQGCKNGCKGCYAKDTWSLNGGIKAAVEDIICQIEEVSEQIEGVTFLGGEPMLQAEALSLIAARIRELGKSVITFTGLTLEKIKEDGNKSQLALVENTDVLIDGPYMEAKRDFSRPLVGSSNQRFHFLTKRYSMEAFSPNRIEIRLGKNGAIRANGMGDFFVLEALLKGKGDEKNGLFRV